ncbi:DUF948 domain-containing protein [Trichothermofontia sp.]
MTDPLFWLGCSLLLVAVSLTAVLVAAIPALQEVARAARSAEKLFDTLGREFPPTLEAIRLTGLEISELTDDITNGVKNAGQVAKQIDQSLSSTRHQVRKAHISTRSAVVGLKAAWKTFTRPSPKGNPHRYGSVRAASPPENRLTLGPSTREFRPPEAESDLAGELRPRSLDEDLPS